MLPEGEHRATPPYFDLRIERFMTPNPWTVVPEDSLLTARKLMAEHSIRHLPVVEHGRVAGIISNRDVGLAEALLLDEQREATVGDVMSTDVYVVDARANVGTVAKHMADSKLGSAIVVNRGRVVGIFTTVDALRALHEMTRSRS